MFHNVLKIFFNISKFSKICTYILLLIDITEIILPNVVIFKKNYFLINLLKYLLQLKHIPFVASCCRVYLFALVGLCVFIYFCKLRSQICRGNCLPIGLTFWRCRCQFSFSSFPFGFFFWDFCSRGPLESQCKYVTNCWRIFWFFKRFKWLQVLASICVSICHKQLSPTRCSYANDEPEPWLLISSLGRWGVTLIMIMIERHAKVNNNNNNIMRTKIQKDKDTDTKIRMQSLRYILQPRGVGQARFQFQSGNTT